MARTEIHKAIAIGTSGIAHHSFCFGGEFFCEIVTCLIIGEAHMSIIRIICKIRSLSDPTLARCW